MKLLWFRVLVLYEEIERASSRLMQFYRSLYSYNFRQHACTIIFMCMLILGPQFYFDLVNPCSFTRYYFFRHERFYGFCNNSSIRPLRPSLPSVSLRSCPRHPYFTPLPFPPFSGSSLPSIPPPFLTTHPPINSPFLPSFLPLHPLLHHSFRPPFRLALWTNRTHPRHDNSFYVNHQALPGVRFLRRMRGDEFP